MNSVDDFYLKYSITELSLKLKDSSDEEKNKILTAIKWHTTDILEGKENAGEAKIQYYKYHL